MNRRIPPAFLGLAFAIGIMLVGCQDAADDDASPATVEAGSTPVGLGGAIPTRTPNTNRPTAGYGSGDGLMPEGAVPRVTDAASPGGDPENRPEGLDAARAFVAPLDGWDAILDRFGAERPSGFVHGGVDFQLDGLENSPIYASCSGVVISVDESPTHSRYVVVRCNEGKWSTVYAHLGEVLVEADDAVDAGNTVLARQGGPTPWGPTMLHFELRWDFIPVDPEAWIDFNVRPSFTIPTPTPTATPPNTATPTNTPTPTSSGPAIPGQPSPTALNTLAPNAPTALPTATPTPTVTPTPTPWIQPTTTPDPPTATPTRIPIATPTPTEPPRPVEPTSTPPIQIF